MTDPSAASPLRPAPGADDRSSSILDAAGFDAAAGDTRMRWMGWRLRLLVLVALAACLGVFALVRLVGATPALDAGWQLDPQDRVVLAASDDARLQPFVGRTLLAIVPRVGVPIVVDDALLQRAPRWTVDAVARQHVVDLHRRLAEALQLGPVALQFENGQVEVRARPRGLAGLGLLFWPMAALALLLTLIGTVVLLVKPQLRNALYALITVCQAGNLMFIAMESVRGVPMPALIVAQDLGLRMGLDVLSGAAILHAMTLHPTPLPRGRWVAAAGWAVALGVRAIGHTAGAGDFWWLAQGTVLLSGLLSIGLLSWSYRVERNPFALVMRRFGFVTAGSLSLLTLAIAAASSVPGIQHRVAEVGSVVWYVFFASVLLLMPFLTRSRQLLREFALLAGISTVATSLDLIFVALFSFGQFTSITLSVFLSLGVYAGARQWILDQLSGSNVLTLERSFDKMYTVAREVEAHPERHAALMLQLLRDLFEPMEVARIARAVPRARVVGDGSALVVPAPPSSTAPPGEMAARAWVLRFARRGKRIFTEADARLADRVAEQLRRAVAYDKAVERGRSEERLRIAQDLHDDIGARLLTLMYKAQSPDMEDYLRHTLQDLKTLTRGLAATEHRLSHAAAEWKADIAQRLSAAHIDLGWSFAYDRDTTLSVVQWSGLTRVLRELVSNTIYHANATRVEIVASLDKGRFSLSVADDGNGRDPASWSHGLGLGGVRKRVKLLGGQVQWRELQPRGICCEVRIDSFVVRWSPEQQSIEP